MANINKVIDPGLLFDFQWTFCQYIAPMQMYIDEARSELGICENDGTPDVYPHHPEDVEMDWFLQTNFQPILSMLKDIKESGNIYYRKVFLGGI